MTRATISEKGQITLPAELRKRVGIKPHDKVFIAVEDNTIVIRPAPDFLKLKGFLGRRKPEARERSLMMEEVAKHVVGQDE